ncbi:2OG-Fe(II) oxygenase family protein [Aquincola sp. MAHUQ-54]|uniref:2OG-Fe(II) oxygenase family protein n=1 Tax=Aquincola agrisoli TaxID=3119538 RepID=A0AAW9Q959_9BURK
MKKHKQKAHKPAGVIELTERNFASAIDGHPLAVVGFWAPSLASSRALVQAFAAASSRHPDVLFATVDAEAQPAIAAQFDVHSVPTSVIFRHNIIVYARGGTPPPEALDKVLGAVRALEMEQVRRNVTSVDEVALGGGGVPADTDSIEAYLRPALRGAGSALAEVGPRLAAGELIAIRDAFEPDFAERMFRSLDQCAAWRVYEGHEADFHYHHHNLYRSEEYPQDMAWCSGLFDSPGTKAWVGRLSGRACPGPAEVGASWYLPGDHSLPHNDVAASGPELHRQVAFVWHLAKDWRPEWGGALFWCAKGSYVPAAFNTLFLFNVTPASTHFVTHVSPFAQGKRLAINGWWTGPAATQAPAWNGPDRIAAGGSEILVY